MKKVILILGLLSISLISCQKENIEPNEPTPTQDCNCGVIVDNNFTINGTLRYIEVENYCTGNLYKHWYPTVEEQASHPHFIGYNWCNTTGETW